MMAKRHHGANRYSLSTGNGGPGARHFGLNSRFIPWQRAAQKTLKIWDFLLAAV
jgi:hypothetical protein